MGIALVSIDTAPRDVAALKTQYQLAGLYRLMHLMGLCSTEEQKIAFHDLSVDARAQTVADALIEHDKRKGTAMNNNPQMPPQMPNNPQQLPFQQQPVQGGFPQQQQQPGGFNPQMPGPQVPVVIPAHMLPPHMGAPGQMPSQPQSMPGQIPTQMPNTMNAPPSFGMPTMPMNSPTSFGMPTMPGPGMSTNPQLVPQQPMQQPIPFPQQPAMQQPQGTNARETNVTLLQIAETIQRLTLVQEQLSASVTELNKRVTGGVKLTNVQLMMLMMLTERALNMDHTQLLEYYKAHLRQGYDEQLSADLLASLMGKA